MRWALALCLVGCTGGPGGTCTPAQGLYALTNLGEGFGTCDLQTVAAMVLEIQNEMGLFGSICVEDVTPCGPIGVSSTGPFAPTLSAQATALGITGATFTLTGPGGCTERFAATFEPTGRFCGVLHRD